MTASPQFFTVERTHFFRPLAGKYREQVIACLRALYSRLYSAEADYSRIVQRDLVVEVFQEAITRTPVLDASEDDTLLPVRGDREQAGWMLNLLLEYGWLERQVDEVTLTSTYAFSRIGRLFTQPMHELEGGRFRTRHRNTRNACNALRSFLDKPEHDASDLLDAYEYSERIVSNFSDVIAELEERKRELLRDVEAQHLVQRAADELFDFMEKRFMPDLAVRFSEDSVIKYREELDGLLRRARAQRRDTKAAVERELRRIAPELVTGPRESVYVQVLNQIENRLHSAADTMLPALRHSLHGVTRRAGKGKIGAGLKSGTPTIRIDLRAAACKEWWVSQRSQWVSQRSLPEISHSSSLTGCRTGELSGLPALAVATQLASVLTEMSS